MFPFPCPLPADDALARRAAGKSAVLDAFPQLGHIPVSKLPADALPRLLYLYDQAFFQGLFADRLPGLHLAATSRMTRCAGKFCVTQERGHDPVTEIRMSSDFLFRLREGPFTVNGLSAADPLEAFMLVFEHELCHAAEWALTGSCDAHQAVFRALSRGLFHHRTCTHSLPTRAQEAAVQGVGVGAHVCFPYCEKNLTGIVSRVGKTASVMVPARGGVWHDKRGRQYDKYTVPLSLLTPLKTPR